MADSLRPRRTRLLYALVGLGGLIIMAFLSMPVLDGPHSRQYANESAAVSKLRAIKSLQQNFAATHADKGFACVLPLLRPADSEQNSANYDPLGFLTTGASGGYKFMLTGCRTDDKGVVVHYEATAVPIERGRTGFYAFCTDDSGLIWYNVEGSATNCLASRRVLE